MLGAVEGRGALLRAQKIAVKGVHGLDAMIDAMTSADLDYFCTIFAKATRVQIAEKRPILADVFDVHFAGHYFEMVQWLSFCLGLNFGPFFSQVQAQGEKIKQAAMLGAGQSEDTAQVTPDESPAE
jgi:hypothetical protein